MRPRRIPATVRPPQRNPPDVPSGVQRAPRRSSFLLRFDLDCSVCPAACRPVLRPFASPACNQAGKSSRFIRRIRSQRGACLPPFSPPPAQITPRPEKYFTPQGRRCVSPPILCCTSSSAWRPGTRRPRLRHLTYFALRRRPVGCERPAAVLTSCNRSR
jgi:hypothetical protein